MEDQRAALRQRPDIEAISARYERMQAELRHRLSTEIGGLVWVKTDNESYRSCAFEFSEVAERESRSLPRWSARGNIAHDRWDQAMTIVQEVTGNYGFGTPEVIVDRPDNHRIAIRGPYGSTLDFGTGVNTVLSVHTGCHLPAQVAPPVIGEEPPEYYR